jgi:hypothetical protein
MYFFFHPCLSRGSVVGIATGYGLDGGGLGGRVPVGSRIFSSPSRPDRLWGTRNFQWVTGALPGVKLPEREADHSPPANAEVKKMWIYTSTPPIRLLGVVINSLITG